MKAVVYKGTRPFAIEDVEDARIDQQGVHTPLLRLSVFAGPGSEVRISAALRLSRIDSFPPSSRFQAARASGIASRSRSTSLPECCN